MAPKRPRGLKAAADAKADGKKQKTEDAKDGAEPKTVMLDADVEEDDELSELQAIYQSAVQKLDSNPTEALALLRGAIHESDRMLRNWEGDVSPPPTFHLVYGSALLDMGQLVQNEEPGPYYEAALERLEAGLESLSEVKGDETEKESVSVTKIHIQLAKTLLTQLQAMASLSTDKKPSPKTIETSQKQIEDAKGHVQKALEMPFGSSPADVSFFSTLPQILLLFSDVADLMDGLVDLDSQIPFYTFALDSLGQLQTKKVELTDDALAIGKMCLAQANAYLAEDDQAEDDQEEDDEDEEEATDAPHATETIAVLEKGLGALKVTTTNMTVDFYATRAELAINLGNFRDETDQEILYKEAVEDIKRIQAIDAEKGEKSLPEGLESFLQDWEESTEA
ncbi:hypothetical protein BZG36_01042 [Bifiguratus adelaidae]|uniref:Enhancer of translation termination 1 n=1 Tax=Bifiguratus adelaidae TaxID=1938954 RepID=A0A261Y6A2_9FUNG|nr:hypothetical protein BZG36_01042 [Bifiguratus adelaidae]